MHGVLQRLSAANIPNPIASPSATTNYVLTVTSADGWYRQRVGNGNDSITVMQEVM